jgi:DNA-damage-inducible protein D
MTDWELIFNMLGEKATTDITRVRDAKNFEENKQAAKIGGQIARNARDELEKETGKSIVSKDNFLGLTEKKRLKKNE